MPRVERPDHFSKGCAAATQHQVGGFEVDNIVFDAISRIEQPCADRQAFVGQLLPQHAHLSGYGSRSRHAIEILQHAMHQAEIQPRVQEHPDEDDCNFLA